jgi:immunoglobulin-binding protein 1
MAAPSRSLQEAFAEAESKRSEVNSLPFDPSPAGRFHEALTASITGYQECLKIADQISLFSPNESLEDVSTKDLQYLQLNHALAEVVIKAASGERKVTLKAAQNLYERFLRQLDAYDALSPADTKTYERFLEDRNGFSVIPTGGDAFARRDAKVARYRDGVAMREKLQVCSSPLTVCSTMSLPVMSRF